MKRIYIYKKRTTPKLNFFLKVFNFCVCKSRYIETKNMQKLKGVDLIFFFFFISLGHEGTKPSFTSTNKLKYNIVNVNIYSPILFCIY